MLSLNYHRHGFFKVAVHIAKTERNRALKCRYKIDHIQFEDVYILVHVGKG